jgi:hypothetical protein
MLGVIRIEFNHEKPLTKKRESTQQARTEHRRRMAMILMTSGAGTKNDGVGILAVNLLAKLHFV